MPATAPEGLLLVDKPAGVTSHDVVARVRRAVGTQRVGHTGTLDPFATGLLVILCGSATRLARYVPAGPKTYDAIFRFGMETDTDDFTGTATRTADLPEPCRVDQAIATLTGTIEQVPPRYSAKQVGGRRAYAAARRGEVLELAPVSVNVYRWDVVLREPGRWHVRVHCGAGTYIRALARDLGRRSGSAAHLESLRRLRAGPFDVADALSLEAVSAAGLRPAVDAIPDLPRVRLDDAAVTRAVQGRVVPGEDAGEHAALVGPDGVLVAVAERAPDGWHPRVVVAHA
jgi:tRNA pseudouridine55 synthase